jgi:subtilisin family serine protease
VGALFLLACADAPTRALDAPATPEPTTAAVADEAVVAHIAAESPGVLADAKRRPDRTIPGRFIVTFRDDVRDPPGLAKRLAAGHGGSVRVTYGGALKGFAGTLPEQAVAALSRAPGVASVEPDRVVSAATMQSMNAAGDPWGLDRIDQRARPLSKSYSYTSTGAGVRVYVFDTGVQVGHPEFGTRAVRVFTAFGDNGFDCIGHGTHVAGVVAGKTYGVAKGALIRSVKVLGGDCTTPDGSLSDVIAAIDWVRLHRVDPAVANMSFGGPFQSTALKTALTNLISSGVFVAVAAGNDADDACGYSPAMTPAAFTVAASDRTDERAYFSNYGPCVDAYGPGVGIKSSVPVNATEVLDGTSQATPFATGIAALYKSKYPNASPTAVTNWLKTNATFNRVRDNIVGTPNSLVFKGSL